MIDSLKSNFSVSMPQMIENTMYTLETFPWDNPSVYTNWLAQTFFIVQHTPRYICLAASRFDYSHNEFHKKLVSHLTDEEEHEEVVLKDLSHLGASIDEFSPLPEVNLLIENLYYQINNIDPICIFGRILFLEYIASNISDDLRKYILSCWKPNQREFLKIHFEEDIQHVKKAFAVVHGLSMDQQKLVGDQFYLTGLLYNHFMAAAEAYQKRPPVFNSKSA